MMNVCPVRSLQLPDLEVRHECHYRVKLLLQVMYFVGEQRKFFFLCSCIKPYNTMHHESSRKGPGREMERIDDESESEREK